jgi:hypothetical protein
MIIALCAALILQTPAPAASAPDTTGARMTNAGVLRAAGVVDSVFVARTRDSATVDAGDWTAYLMARLGVRPIPETGLRVTIDPTRLRVHGKVGDIPHEAQVSLAALVSMFDPTTPLEASVSLDRPSPNAIRFHLDSAWISGFAIPEAMLGPGLQVVGDKYPVLMNGGRDLFVEIPPGGEVRFTPLGVTLLGPPHPVPPRPTAPPRSRARPRPR